MNTEISYSKTYWSNAGKHEELKDKLRPLVPDSGEVENHETNPALETFRIASNCYYDLYNNGLCNRGKEFHEAFGFNAFDVGELVGNVDDDGDPYEGSLELTQELIDRTEIRVDEIILAAYAEQFPTPKLDLYTTAKAFRDAVAQIDFSSLPGAYDSIPWADMDKILAEN